MKRLLSAITAMLMLLAAFSALAATRETTYNEHDLSKLAAFLEIADSSGRTNGWKLDPGYDPADPSTWGVDADGEPCFVWTGGAEKRIERISVRSKDLVGALDVSGCDALSGIFISDNDITGLNASGCAGLSEIYAGGCLIERMDLTGCAGLSYLFAYQNRLTALDLSDCTALYQLDVSDNLLTELDLTGLARLYSLSCVNNAITGLELSGCPGLAYLYATDNRISCIDLSANPRLYRVTLSRNPIEKLDLTGITEPDIVYCAECPLKCIDLHDCAAFPVKAAYTLGGGRCDYAYSDGMGSGSMTAVPDEGESFLGWYTFEGEPVSESAYISINRSSPRILIARFSGAAAGQGDADLSGTIDTTDALYALRCALGIERAFVDMPQCDMDGSAFIDTTDALRILRLALGIEHTHVREAHTTRP